MQLSLRLAGDLLLLSKLLLHTEGKLVNVTIDDAGADPLTGHSIQYVPSDRWNSARGACSTCTAKPDPSKVYNATWHDATYNGTVGSQNNIETATFRFTGKLAPVLWSLLFAERLTTPLVQVLLSTSMELSQSQ